MSFLKEFDQKSPLEQYFFFNACIDSGSDWRGMFKELRTDRPILKIEIPDKARLFIVTRWHDVIDVLRQHMLFTVAPYREAMDPSVGPFMLARDGAGPVRDEKAKMLAVMSSRDNHSIRAIAREAAYEALSGARGTIDLVSTVSRPVPLKVVQEYFGFAGNNDEMLAWSRATQHDMFRNADLDLDVHARNLAAGDAMQNAVQGLLTARYNEPGAAGDDVLGRLVRLSKADQTFIGIDRVRTNVCGFLVGAIETSSQAIIHLTQQILQRKEVTAKAQKAADEDDDETLLPIVREALRFNPITTLLGRQVPENSEAVLARGTDDQTTVPGKALVVAAIGSAMFDEAGFPEADTFKTDASSRPPGNYLHFGYGHHECLGSAAGELIVLETVKQIFRLPGLAPVNKSGGRIDYGPKVGMRRGPFPEKYEVKVT